MKIFFSHCKFIFSMHIFNAFELVVLSFAVRLPYLLSEFSNSFYNLNAKYLSMDIFDEKMVMNSCSFVFYSH